MSAIPTGSLAPASPSRMAPAAARRPRAGPGRRTPPPGRSGRYCGGHEQRDIPRPGRGRQCRSSAVRRPSVRNVPRTPATGDRGGGGPEPGPADVHAPVEQDAGQRDDVRPRARRPAASGACRAGTTLRRDGGPHRQDRRRRRGCRPGGYQAGWTAPRRGPTAAASSYQQGERLGASHDGAPPGRSRLTHYRPGFPAHHCQV